MFFCILFRFKKKQKTKNPKISWWPGVGGQKPRNLSFVLPMTMFALREGDFTTTSDPIRAQNIQVNKELLLNEKCGAYSVTLDGNTIGKKEWLQQYAACDMPAIILVRDPIKTLISVINFVSDSNPADFDFINYWLESCQFSGLSDFSTTIGFYSNYKLIEPYTNKILYVDCQEIIRSSTRQTMEKVADFLGFEVPDRENFDMQVNDSITRLLPLEIEISGFKIFASAYNGRFTQRDVYPLYHAKDTRCYIAKNYKCNHIPNHEFFISTTAKTFPKHLEAKLYQVVDDELAQVANQAKSNKTKAIAVDFFFEFLCENPHWWHKLDSVIKYEITHIKQVRQDIVDSWLSYKAFCELGPLLKQTK
ncbi:DUF2972 domain-containing protein [Helicobacter sp. 'CLO3_human']|uniref:DUF2972 domain-containing protein n=1 Tax=Helicobacter sp. 'CLO3_human' TaxID=2020249 RepID=UPI000CF185DA|nr:DUF2972 domain-containing protein [Helicobacter sp. 'CLO3_human']